MPLGVYIHIPFCNGKCPYCDFYSLRGNAQLKNDYTNAVLKEISGFAGENLSCNTLYIGGGTPLQLGTENLCKIIAHAHSVFNVNEEVTVEVNPANDLRGDMRALYSAGVNRISIGMQSAVPDELCALGRTHTAQQSAFAAEAARQAGINNISLDIMLGIPRQTKESLKETVRFALNLNPAHISAYMLKIEPGTLFYAKKDEIGAADDEQSAELYMLLCSLLGENGYNHYEISNFEKGGCPSKHNLKYWQGEEYIGIGAAAHSFYKGKRYFYNRHILNYINGEKPVADGEGGGADESVMLGLRLKEGISRSDIFNRFLFDFAQGNEGFLRELNKNGLALWDGDRLQLTEKGFLLSNSIIGRLIN